MNNSDLIVAIEIGSSKIKGAVGQVDSSGNLHVKSIEEEHQHVNYVRYGCVQNVKEVANELNRVITKLTNCIKPAKITAVYVGIGGRSLKSTSSHLKLSFNTDTEISSDIVARLLKQAKVIGDDVELLDIEPVEFQVDGKSQDADPVGILARELSADVTLISCRQQIRRNLELAIKDKLDLTINGVVVRPTAMADLVLTSDEKRLGAMLVDCGAETTTVSLYKGGALIYLATIPLGSRHITRDLMTLPALEEKAEELKRMCGNVTPNAEESNNTIVEVDVTKINKIISSRASEIIANISAQIEYAGMKHTDFPEGMVLVGGGAELRGFPELLAQQTAMSVRRGTLPATVRCSKVSTGEDLDVIALLYSLTQKDNVLPCTVTPEPVVIEETANQETNDSDDFEDEEGFEDEEEMMSGSKSLKDRLKGLWSNLRQPQELDSFDD